MRKLYSKVLTIALAAFMATPAALAQYERTLVPAPVVFTSDIRAQAPPIMAPMTIGAALKNNPKIKRSATNENVQTLLNRRNSSGLSVALTGGQPTFNAVVVYADGYPNGNFPVADMQLTQFPTQTPCTPETLTMWNLTYGAAYGAVMGAEYYYVSDAAVNQYGNIYYESGKVFDPKTWELISEVPYSNISALLICGTYDPTTGNIYAVSYNAQGNGIQFGIFDPETFTTSCIADLNVNYRAISCNAEGQIYAIDMNGDFGTINKVNGSFSLIKATGLASLYATSGAIDTQSSTPLFYYATSSMDGTDLFAIDCETGEYSYIYTFNNGQELMGMYFERPKSESETNAPGKAKIEGVDFMGASLSGTVSFTAPLTLANGEDAPAGQTMTYEIVANGNVVSAGPGIEYGKSYQESVSIDTPGMYSINVYLYNEMGRSLKSNTVTKWIGADIPVAVKNVNAEWVPSQMTVTWEAASTGINGGSLENVTYSLYNAADDTLIVDGITETSYTFNLAEPLDYTEYQYYVIATSNGYQSEPALSNKLALGNIQAPFSTEINSSATPDWTITDVNGDGKTWSLSNDCATYQYSSSSSADDWLITNGIKVQSGLLYTVSLSAKVQSSSYPEKFEVMAGTSPEVSAMTSNVIEETTITNTDYITYSGTFIAESDLVFLGIHAVSAKNQWTLYVNELSINGGVNGNAPEKVSSLSVQTSDNGENKATLTYTTPTTALLGNELEGEYALTRVEVLVNDNIEYIDNNPTPGTESTIDLVLPSFGVYKFQVACYNEYGAGDFAEISAYVGVNVPSAVTNATITEVADGVVNVTWDAVSTDVNGNEMNPALVTYSVAAPVYNQYGEIVDLDFLVDGISETFVNDIQAVPAGEQEFVKYMVFSKTEAGERYSWTNMPAVGTPYDLPYIEYFPNGNIEHILGEGPGDSWVVLDHSAGYESRNSDNGYLGCYGPKIMGSYYGGANYGSIYTGKIELTGDNPELSFYYLGINPTCENSVVTKIICDGETTDIDEVICSGNFEWKLRRVDLSAYSGKTVQIIFYVKRAYSTLGLPNVDYMFIGLLDDIRIGEPLKVDLVAKQISAPSTILTENEFNIGYSIYNQGSEEATDVHVSLYADGNLVESSVKTITIGSGETVTGSFEQQAYSLFEKGTYEFSYVVECAADLDPTNNTSNLVKVTVNNTDFPTLQLSGTNEKSEDGTSATINLLWDAPEIDLTYGIEGFESESYPAWTTEDFAGWTLLNFNDNPTYGFGDDASFPDMGGGFGWILFDSEELGFNEEGNQFAAYEGSCCMVAFSHTAGINDAWLISPAQSGEAQTVTFMAKAARTNYGPETMRCYYSTTGTEVSDFNMVVIQGYNMGAGVPGEWTQYSIELPEGAKYFAIRSTANNTFALLIDNITFMGGTSPFEYLEMVGYEVYRNQEKLTATPINVEEYTDIVNVDGTYDYSVVAVYNEGKSAPSNIYTVEVNLTPVGISDVAAQTKVSVQDHDIIVTGAGTVTIATADGKLVYSGGSRRVSVAPGVYMVKADHLVSKVIVK